MRLYSGDFHVDDGMMTIMEIISKLYSRISEAICTGVISSLELFSIYVKHHGAIDNHVTYFARVLHFVLPKLLVIRGPALSLAP